MVVAALDYRPPWTCAVQQRCAQRAHAALWQLPLASLVSRQNTTYRRLSDAAIEMVASSERPADRLYQFVSKYS